MHQRFDFGLLCILNNPITPNQCKHWPHLKYCPYMTMLQLHCEWNAGAPMLSMTMLQLARKWNADIVDAVDSTTMLQLINEWNASTPLRVKCRCADAVLHNASTCAQVKCRHCRCRRAYDISSTPCGVKCRCADAVCQRRQCFNSVVVEMPT